MVALIGPLLLAVAAGVNVALPCTGSGCTDLERRTLVLLAIAAPIFPALVALPGALPLFVSLVVGAGLSAPLWALLGRRLAERAVDAGTGWKGFWRLYALAFAGWCGVAVLAVILLRRTLL